MSSCVCFLGVYLFFTNFMKINNKVGDGGVDSQCIRYGQRSRCTHSDTLKRNKRQDRRLVNRTDRTKRNKEKYLKIYFCQGMVFFESVCYRRAPSRSNVVAPQVELFECRISVNEKKKKEGRCEFAYRNLNCCFDTILLLLDFSLSIY